MLTTLIHQLKEFPEYFHALQGALTIIAIALPLYLGMRYFLYKRRLTMTIGMTLNFFSVFILFAGLSFLLSSPLVSYVPGSSITAYLFLTCMAAAFGIVSLVDVFLLQHYLIQVKRIYISPPLRAVIKICVFCMALLPILRFVLHFNPLALVAIPTIATAAIAFALQDTLKTFIAGVGLGHLIRLGEWIAFQDKEGFVVDINWARTTIETADGQRVFIPNSLLQTGVFHNFTAGSPANRQSLKISASYEAVPSKVKQTLVRCTEGVPGIVRTPAPLACLVEYADSGIVYGLYYWIEEYTVRVKVQDEVATRVWYAFQREGIGIPYPTRTIHLERKTDSLKKMRTHVEEALKRWNLAEAFYSEELADLSQSTLSRVFAPGEIIIRRGEPGQSLFAIASGEVEVFVGPTLDRPVATLGEREIFGEMSLLTGEPRAATVRARTSVEVLEIDKPAIQHILAKRPEISDRLSELVVRRRAALAAVAGGEKASGHEETIEEDQTLAKRIREFFGLA